MAVGGVFRSRGYSIQTRRCLFYGVCVPVRLALAAAAGYLCHLEPTLVASIVLPLMAGIAFNNFYQAWKPQAAIVWWNRPAHGMLAVVVVVSCAFILSGLLEPWTLGVFLALNVPFGLAASVCAPSVDDDLFGQ